MVKPARRTRLACCLLLLNFFSVHAGGFPVWRTGETATRDVATPGALDVVDAGATAAGRAALALKVPAIFLSDNSATNIIVRQVTTAFTEAHSNFLFGIQESFQKRVLDEPTIQTPDFGYFVTAFNIQNKSFPINSDLARRWAHGESGLTTKTNLIQLLLQAMSQPVRPDRLPAGFTLGKTVRLVPAAGASEAPTLAGAEERGKIVAANNLIPLTRLREQFRGQFQFQDQLFARALANFLRPNCTLDTNLTQQARAREINQLVVINHYEPGEMIVRSGQVIDDKIQAALTRLSETQTPGQPAGPVVAVHNPVPVATPPPDRLVFGQTPTPHAKLGQPQNQKVKPQNHGLWLAAGIVAISIIGLLVIGGLLARRKKFADLNRSAALPARTQQAMPVELAPQIAQALKSAVAQELAVQRQELLITQRNATADVMRLMHRLNELHAPLQERMAAYEQRIQELEKELTLRTEENRELLRLKIDLLRQQLETERGNQRVNFN